MATTSPAPPGAPDIAQGRPPAGWSRGQRLFYDFLHVTCRLLGVAQYGIRVHGRQHVPRRGGVLVLSNHQSFLDPVIIGVALDRRMTCVARQSLFRNPFFGALIGYLRAIPIEREGVGIAGLKEMLRRLKRGEAVVLFPEGTRTHDGEVRPLRPGFYAVARRAGVPVLPVAMDGAFDVWPRSRALPSLTGQIVVQFGPPIEPGEVARRSEAELVAEVASRIRQCHAQARRRRLGRSVPGSG